MTRSPFNADGTVIRAQPPVASDEDLPSDAAMLDWVESKMAVVAPRYKGEWQLFVLYEKGGYGKVVSIEEYGPTWRAVVEAAMRRLP